MKEGKIRVGRMTVTEAVEVTPWQMIRAGLSSNHHGERWADLRGLEETEQGTPGTDFQISGLHTWTRVVSQIQETLPNMQWLLALKNTFWGDS